MSHVSRSAKARHLAGAVLAIALAGAATTCRLQDLVKPGRVGTIEVTMAQLVDSARLGSTAPVVRAVPIAVSFGAQPWTSSALLGSSWIQIVTTSGTAPDTLTVILNPIGLAAGAYQDTLVITPSGPTSEPHRVPIVFTVTGCAVTDIAVGVQLTDSLRASDCGAPHRSGRYARLYRFAASANDSITLALSSAAFDAYLVLDSGSAQAAAPPLAENDACRAGQRDACLVYVRMPRTASYVAEVTSADPNAAGTFSFGVTRPRPPAAPDTLGQLATDLATPVPAGGAVAQDTIALRASLSDPDKDPVRLEVEVRPLGTPLSGVATATSGFVASGTRVAIVDSALGNYTGYRWQARAVDQTGRASAWVPFGTGAADFRVAIPQPPNLPASLAQLRYDGTAAIGVGGTTDHATVLFQALVTDPDSGDVIRLEVEAQPVGTAFVNVATGSSTPAANGSVATATITGFRDNVAHHWQARTVDQTGRASAWTSFGGNAESATDFRVALPPSQLTVLTQPGSTAAGSAIAPAVRVAAQDAVGNTLASFTGNVSVALGANPPGGTLSGTSSVAAVAGIASFSNLSLNKAGSGYTLAFSAGALGVTSAAFAVTSGVASAATSTVSVSSGSVASGAPVTLTLQAKDAQGNNLSSGGLVVAFAASGGTSTGTIGSTTDNGDGSYVATFTGVTAGTATTIGATIGGVAVTSPLPTIAVTPGPISTSRSQVTVSSASVASGSPVTLTLRGKDAAGNNLTSGGAVVLFSSSGGTSTGTIGPTADAGNGTYTATFTAVSAGTATTIGATIGGVAVTSTPLPTVTVISSNVSATQTTVSASPTTITASSGSSAATVTVTAKDAAGNPVSGATVTLAATGSGNTLGQPSAPTNAGGVTTGTFSSSVAGSHTLTATVAGVVAAQQPGVTVKPAAAASLAFLVQPTDIAAGAAIAPAVQVQVLDAFGNLDTASTAPITVALAANPGGATLGGTLTRPAVAGVASFADLTLNRAAAGYTLSAASGSLTGATSASFTVGVGSGLRLVFTTQPPASVTAGSPFGAGVTVRDSLGNTVTSFNGSVTVAIGANPGGAALSGTATVSAASGVATFSGLSIDKSGSGYTLTASATAAAAGASSAFAITAGAAATIAVQAGDGQTATAGTAVAVAPAVIVRDANNNPVGGVSVAFAVASGGGSVVPTTAVTTGTNGIAAVTSWTLGTTAGPNTLTAASGTLSGSPVTFTATGAAGAATQIAVQSGDGQTATAGTAVAVLPSVIVRDASNNPVSGVSVTFAVTAGGGSVVPTTPVTTGTNGIAAVTSWTLGTVAGPNALTATSGALSGSPVTFTATGTAGAATKIAVQAGDGQSAPVGTAVPVPPAVIVRDANNNPVSGVSVTFAVASGGGTVVPTTAVTTGSNGIAAVTSWTLGTAAGSNTLTAISGTLLGSPVTFTATGTPGAVAKLVFTTAPPSTTAGTAFGVTVTAEDAQNNTVTSYTGTDTLAIGTNAGGGTLSGPKIVAATAGVANFAGLSIDKAGTGYTLLAHSGALTVTSSPFNITAGSAVSASQSTVVAVPTGITASNGSSAAAITVTAKDGLGNPIAGVSVTLFATGSGNAVVQPSATTNASGVATGSFSSTASGAHIVSASVGGVIATQQDTITVSPAAPAELTFLTQPSNVASGVTMSPAVQVQVQDVFNNVVTGAVGTVTLALTTPGGATLTGGGPATVASGVATFSGLSVNKVGTYTLTPSTTVTGVSVLPASTSFAVSAAAASQLAIATQPSATAQNGVAFGQQPAVQLEDAAGNAVSEPGVVVTAAIATGGGTLGGTLTATTSAGGLATFTSLAITGTVGSRTLSFSAPLLTGATSSSISVTAGTASQLAWTQQPSAVAAGATMSPAVTVTVEDANGNVVTTASGNVSLALTAPGGATLTGGGAQAVTNGVATFSALSVDKAGTYTLTPSTTVSGVTTLPVSGSFAVSAGAATQLVWTQQPSAVVAGATMTPAVTVTVEDANGNVVTTASGNVSLALTTPAGATLTGGGAATVTNGVATFGGLSVNKSGAYTLTPSTTVGGVTTLPVSTSFTVSAGTGTQLVWTQQPSAVVAGATMTPAVTVTVEDANGNTVTSATGTVTLALTTPGGATLTGGGPATVASGVATFSGLSVNKSGTYTFAPTTTASGVTTLPASGSFAVTAGSASQLVWTQQPSAVVAGATMGPAVIVTVEDANGNVVAGASGTVSLALTTPSGATLTGGGPATVSSGVATFGGLSVNKVGSYTLTPSTTVGGVTTLPVSMSFAVTAGSASQLAWTQQPSAVVAGATMAPAVTVTVEDANGNTVTSATGTVTVALTTPGGATLTGGGAQTVTNGVATFSGLSVNKAGTYTLTPSTTVGGVTTLPISSSFVVGAATATQLAWSQQPSAVVAGATMAPTVTVTVEDAQGNTVTGASGTVSLALTTPGGATLTGGGPATVTGGVATFAGLSVNKVGTYSFTPTTTVSGVTTLPASGSFAVSAGSASQLVWTQQPSAVVAGATMTPAVTVTVEDANGNVVTTASGNMSLALTTPAGATLTGGGAATVTSGVATFGGLSVNKSGTYTLTPSTTVGGVTTLPISTSFAVSAGAASQLAWTQQPSAVAAGATMTPAVTVTVEDANGNTVTSASGTVTVALTTANGATLTGGGAATVTSGVATFGGLSVNKAGTYTLTPSTTVGGVTTLPNSGSFAVGAGGATQLVWTQQPSAVVAGATMTPAVTVTVEDANGNTVTGASGSVTLALTTPNGATLTGGGPVTVANGVATFSGLVVNKVGSYTFTPATTVSGVTTLPASGSFAVSAGAATQLVWTQQPPSAVVAGATMAPAVTVTVEDANGNAVTGASGTVSVALTTANGATLTGGGAATVTSGVATFGGLSVDKAGTYTLTPATTVSGVTTLPVSGSFTVSPGAATKLVFTVQPPSTTAGSSFPVTVTAQDAQNNTATSFTGTDTLAIGTNPASGTLSGTLIVAATNGVVSFTGLSIDKAGTGYTLTVKSGTLSATSTAFNISAGNTVSASQSTAVAAPTGITASNGSSASTITVTAKDALGNPIQGVSVLLTATGSGNLVQPVGTTNASGVATGSFSSTSAGQHIVSATVGGVAVNQQDTIAVSPASATSLVFPSQSQPSNVVAGASITPAVQVQVQDAFGNVVTAASGTVTVALTAPGGATLSGGGPATVASGVATFSALSVNKVGTYTLTPSTTVAGVTTFQVSSSFAVSAGAPSQVVWTQQPSAVVAAATMSPAPAATVEDASGNVVTTASGTVTLALTTPGGATLTGGGPVTVTNGVATFSGLSVNKVGTYTFTPTTTVSGVTTLPVSGSFAVSAGSASQLVWTQQPTPVVAGATMSPAVIVTVEDANGNTVTGAGGTVTLTLTTPAGATLTGGGPATVASGVATFGGLSVNKVGTYTFTPTTTVSGVTTLPVSGSFAVSAGAASQMVWTQQPSAVVAGATMSPAVTVTVQDANGNTVTGAGGTVTLTLTTPAGATLTGGGPTTVVSGVATFSGLSVNKVGTYTFTPATTVSGVTTLPVSGSFAVSAGTATQLVWTQQPSAVAAGATMAPAVTVTVEDANGNTVTGASGTVTLALTTPGGATLTGGGAATVTNGVATFSGLSVNKVGTYTLTPSTTVGGVTTLPVSGSFAVSAGAATQLVWTQQPSPVVAGATMAPAVTVTVEDANGNTVTGATGTVTVALTTPAGATLTGGGAATVTNGVATFSGLSVNKVGTYTLTPSTTVGGVTTLPVSGSFAVSAGSASQLVWTQQPSAVVAGATMSPAVTVTVEDANGNAVTGATGTVTVALTTPGGATLTGGGAATVTSGVATFGSLSVNKSGTYTLTPTTTVGGVTALPASGSFAVSAGAASQLVWTQQPSPVVAGATMSPAVTVTVEDANGNTVTGASGTVSLALTTPGGATLTGGGAQTVTNGVATFAGLSVNKVGTYTFTPSTTVSGVTTLPASGSFAVSPGTATQLVWTQEPSPVVAGSTMTPAVTVTVEDANGNTVTGATGNVTLTLTTPGGATLTGGGAQTVTNGVATFSGLSVNKVGTYTLTPSTTVSGVTTLPVSGSFAVSAGAATQLVWTQQPSALVAGATMSPAVTVTVEDANGNTVTGASGTVTLALTTPGGATLTGGGAQTVTNGLATFSALSVNKVGTYTLTPSTTVGGVATLPVSGSFAVSAGAATQLVWTQEPSAVVAGATMTPAVTVTVEDANSNTVTTASGNVSLVLTTPGGATLTGGGAQGVANGVATFSGLSVNKVGTYTFTPSTTVSGVTTLPVSGSFAVSAGAASQLAWTQQPSAVVAGATIAPAVTVTVEDANGNTVTGATGTVTVALTTPAGATLTGGGAATVTGGVATFGSLSVNKSGTYTLTPSTTVGGVTALPASGSFAVNAGAASQLVWTQQPSAVVAGATMSPAVTVTVEDANGNTVTGASGTVSLALTTPAGATLSGGGAAAVTSGVATFGGLTVNKVGTYTLTPSTTVSGVTTLPVSGSFAVSAGAASQLAWTQQPSAVVAGATMAPAVTVTVEDANGNTVTGASGTVSLALTTPGGATLTGGGAATVTNGVATYGSLSVNKSGTYTLTPSTTVSGVTTLPVSSGFTVSPGAASQLAWTQQPSAVLAGATMAPAVTVTVEDGNGNTVTGASGTVTLALTTPGGATLTGGGAASVTGGVATFGGLSVDKVGTYTLTPSTSVAGVTTLPVSGSFAVSAGAATQLVWTQQPSAVVAGATMTPAVTVTVEDANGNTVTGASGTVSLALTTPGGATLTGGGPVTVTNGVATFSGLSVNKVGTYTFTPSTTVSGVTTLPASGSFTVSVGAATQLVWTQEPSNIISTQAMTPAPAVAVEDANGNVVTTATGTVTLTQTPPRGATLTGGGPVTISSGVATFTGLTLNKSGSYQLQSTTNVAGVTSPGPLSTSFTVSSGVATQLAWTQQPSAVVSGATMAPPVTVTVEDNQGNVVVTAVGTISLALTTPGGATLTGGGAQTVTNGVATFSGLSVNKAASYTLTPSTTVSGVTTLPASASFAVSAGAASQLVWAQQPSAVASGATMSPAVTVDVEDTAGNVVTTASGTVTLVLTTPAGATLTGGGAQTVTNGVATFSGLSVDKVGTYTFTPSTTVGGVTTLPASGSFTVSAGSASKLVWTQQPSDVVAGATMAPAVTVTVEDANGNTVTGATGTVTVALTTPGGATLTGGGAQTVTNGVATFNGLSVNKVGTYTFTPSTTVAGVTTLPASGGFAVSAGSASQLVWTQQPSVVVAGATMAPAVTVTVEDANGNTVTGATGTVTVALTTPGGATLTGGGAQAVTNGVATFNGLSVNKVGTYTFTPTTTVSGVATLPVSASFAVSAGSASQLAWTQQPSAVVAGATMAPAVTVTVEDANGNTVTGASGTVTVALTTPGGATLAGGGAQTVTNGVATFNGLSVNKVGTYTFTPTTTVSGVTTLPVSGSFAVSAGAATQLAWTQEPSNVASGATMTPAVTLTVEDANGNTVTGASGTVTLVLTTPGGATLTGGGAQTVTNGVATFSGLKVDKVGTYTLTPSTTVGGVTTLPVSSSFTLSAGLASQLVITTQPSATAQSGVAFAQQPVVQLEDAAGNSVSQSGVAVTAGVATGGGTLGGTLTVNTNGTGAAVFTDLEVTGTAGPRTLGFNTISLFSPATNAISITAGAASKLVWTQQPSAIVAGATMTPAVTVTVEDASGNTVTGASGTVTVVLTTPGGATLTGGGAQAVTNGVATFSGLSVNKVGTYTFTPSTTVSGVTTLPASGSFTVSTGTPSQLVWTQQPSDVVAGATMTPAVTVTVEDNQGNVVTTASGDVSLALTTPGGATLTGGGAQAVASGVATFSGLSVDKAGTYTLTPSTTVSGVTTRPVSGSFTVSAAAPSASQTTASVPAGTAGSPTTITITVRDAFGNVRTASNDASLLSVSVSGTNTATPAVSSAGSGTYTASYTPTGTGTDDIAITLSSTPIGGGPYSSAVSPGPASTTTSTVSAIPTTVSIATQTSTVTVQLKDANGNNLSTSGGTVTVAVDPSSTGSGSFLTGVKDNGDGTYTATFTPTGIGSVLITATLNTNALSNTATITVTL